jgi:hypothetical protein
MQCLEEELGRYRVPTNGEMEFTEDGPDERANNRSSPNL